MQHRKLVIASSRHVFTKLKSVKTHA